jgi:iron complex outermembrane recepter protein
MRPDAVSAELRSVLAAAALMGVAPLACAQQAVGTQASTAATPTPTVGSDSALNEVVVTAQKRSERVQDVPISITALSGNDLARQNVQTTSDLPSVVSGLVWGNQGAWIEPNIRGISTNVAAVGASSPIAIYLDGIYQPMQASTPFDLPDVERIEVLKGPQGTLFGRNATGGAISVYTLNPLFTTSGKFDVTGGFVGGDSARDSGHYQARGYVTGALVPDTLAGSLSASVDQTDGYITNDVTGQRAGKISSQIIRGKLLWQISDIASVLATTYYTHGEDQASEAAFPQHGVTVGTQYPGYVIPTQPWHFAPEGPTPGAWRDIRGSSIKAQLDLAAGTLTSLTGYSDYSVRNFVAVHAAYSPTCVAAFVCIDGEVDSVERAASEEINFASKQFGIARVIAGFFYLHDWAREHDSYNDAAFTDDTVVHTDAYAFYTEGNFDLTSRLTGIAGVRFSDETKKYDGRYFAQSFVQYENNTWKSVTPRVSLTYKLTDAMNTYFTYSTGFKAGVASGQLTTAPAANPEKLGAYEVGLKAAQSNYLLDVAAFYYDYKDLQVETFNNLVVTPQNAATAEIYGLDFDGTVKLTDQFELRLDTSWLPTAKYKSFPNAITFLPPLGPAGLVTNNTYNASGDRMLTTPKWTGSLSGTYTTDVSAGKLAATLSVYYSDSYRWTYPGTVMTGSYALLNGRLTFSPKSSNFQYSVYGKNLTNRAYVQGALPTAEANTVFYGRPREVGLTLSYNF